MDFMAAVGLDTRVGLPTIVFSLMSRTMESAPPCQSSVGSCRAYAQLFIHPMACREDIRWLSVSLGSSHVTAA